MSQTFHKAGFPFIHISQVCNYGTKMSLQSLCICKRIGTVSVESRYNKVRGYHDQLEDDCMGITMVVYLLICL